MKEPRWTRRQRTVQGVTATAALFVLAACAPGSSGSGTAQSSAGARASGGPSGGSATVNPANVGNVTLSVWDQEVRGGQNQEITQLNKQFQEKYPNVTIKRTSRSFSDLKTTLKLALSGNNPPDIVQANQGYPDMVTFVKDGLLKPLDSYAAAYGWAKRYPKSLLDLNRVSSDAKHFGTGSLYGLSQSGEFIGIYYNKANLAKAHLSPPQTWAEFTADLAKLKAAGVLPIVFGNLDKYPAIHEFGVIQDQIAGAQYVRNLVFGTGNVKFSDSKTLQAATLMQGWVKKGYFSSGANGLSYDDAAKQFASGTGAFLITGTWELPTLAQPMGSKLGYILPPPPSGQQPVTTGGEGLAWAITSKSKHAGVAAAYINFITSPHAAKVMVNAGVLPAVLGSAGSSAKPSSPEAQMFADWQKISSVNGLVPYLDYSTPTFYDTLTAALQKLIGGQETPQQFVNEVQADYGSFHGQ